MLRAIIEKEIRDVIVSTRFAVSFGLAAVLILLSFYTGATSYKVSRAAYEAGKAETVRQIEAMSDWMEVQEHRIFLPPQPPASLVSGISNDIGRTARVGGGGEPTPGDSHFSENPIFAVFRFLDLEFVFAIVLSLFAMVMGYDAICGEKERGTLRLSFANPLPRSRFILGKIIGLFLALAIPLVLVLAIGALLLPLMGVPMGGEDWLRLALVILTGLLYVGVFLTLSVFVSSLSARSSSSFLILLVLWISSVLIIPRSAVLLAGRSVEVPSVDEILSQKARLASQLWQEDRLKMADFKPANPAADIQQQVSELNAFMDSLAGERDRKMEDLAGRLGEDRFNHQKQQQRLALGLARTSPSASLSLALTSLAGTSLSLENRFLSNAKDYQKSFGRFKKEKTGVNLSGVRMMKIDGSDTGRKPHLNASEMPQFDYRPEHLSQSLSAAVFDIGLLSLFLLLFFAGAFKAFLRYDLR